METEYNNSMDAMETAIHQWKTHNTIQKSRIMSWPPQQMRSNPPSDKTSPSKSLQPKTENKPKIRLQ